MIALALAALFLRTDTAPVIVYPPSATNGEVRSASIPGSVAYSNANTRLDAHAAAAMYGSLDGLFQRRIFPRLINYGGARGKSAADLATADFYNATNAGTLASANWLGVSTFETDACLADATNRTFASHGRRLLGYRSLLDDWIIGEGTGGKSFSLAKRYIPSDYNVWLHPDVNHDSLPTGTWSMDDEAATADWSRYLLCLGELPSTNVTLYANGGTVAYRPFRIRSVPHVDRSIDANSFLSEGAFPTVLSAVGTDGLSWNVRSDMTTARGASYGDAFERSTVTNRSSRRVWWERQALANETLARMAVSVHAPNGDLTRSADYVSETSEEAVFAGRAPYYNFMTREFTGNVCGAILLRLKAGEPIGISTVGSEVRVGFTRENWEIVSSSNTNAVSITTNSTHYLDRAWTDTSASGGVDLRANRYLRLEDFTFTAPDMTDFRSPIGCEMTVTGEMEYRVNLYITDPYNMVIATYSGPDTNWVATLSAEVACAVAGRDYLQVANFAGPTVLDEHAEATSGRPYSVRAVTPHPMLFTAGVIDRVSVHSFDTQAVTTNAAAIANVAEGGLFRYGYPIDEAGHRKDTWAFFRQAVIGTARSASSLNDLFDTAYSSYASDAADAEAGFPHSGYQEPTMTEALSLPRVRMEALLTKEIREQRLVIASEPGPIGGFETSLYYCHDSVNGYHVEDASGNIVTSGVIGSESVAVTLPVTQTFRKSYAHHYERRPFCITYWLFPAMRKVNQ